MNDGIFILLIGPTGSGKSTLMKQVILTNPDIGIPYSYTTRTPRPEHIENNHYQFISAEDFKSKIAQGEFLEWAEYSGNYYGTLASEVKSRLAEGKVLLKEIEVQGARKICALLPKEQIATIFIDAGDWEVLEKRVRARAPMSEEELRERKKHFDDERTFMDDANFIIKNEEGEKEKSTEKFLELIQTIKNRLHT